MSKQQRSWMDLDLRRDRDMEWPFPRYPERLLFFEQFGIVISKDESIPGMHVEAQRLARATRHLSSLGAALGSR